MSRGKRHETPHGSPAGFEAGCRSRGGCLYHGSDEHLTCVEAWTARNSNIALLELPKYQPILQSNIALTSVRMGPSGTRVNALSPQVETFTSSTEVRHGTTWGYRRGCRSDEACPHWVMGKLTCAESKRRYFEDYYQERLTGAGTPISHGTTKGYQAGCRGKSECPGDDSGTTCAQARSHYTRRRNLKLGVINSNPAVNAVEAVEVLEQLRMEGFSFRKMEQIIGVGRTTLARLFEMSEMNNSTVTANLRTVQKILALKKLCEVIEMKENRAA